MHPQLPLADIWSFHVPGAHISLDLNRQGDIRYGECEDARTVLIHLSAISLTEHSSKAFVSLLGKLQ